VHVCAFLCIFVHFCAFLCALCIFVHFFCVFVHFCAFFVRFVHCCAFLCVFMRFCAFLYALSSILRAMANSQSAKTHFKIAPKIVRVNEAFKKILSDEKESPFSLCFFLTFGGRFQKTFYDCNSGATTISITTFSITTLSIITLSITPLCIMAFSIMGIFATLSINDTHHKQHSV
jgi:hypothetical protein